MTKFTCKKCDKEFCSKQSLQNHEKRKTPCKKNSKTKWQCDRCKIYLSTKQKLTNHKNRKRKCEIKDGEYIPPKTKIRQKVDIEKGKVLMLNHMKKEYIREIIKCNKKYSYNIQMNRMIKGKLEKKWKYNVRKLKERRTLPEMIPSILDNPDEFKNESVETLIEYLKLLQMKVNRYEKSINELEDDLDEHSETVFSILKASEDVVDDKLKMLKIKKELRKHYTREQIRDILKYKNMIEEEKHN